MPGIELLKGLVWEVDAKSCSEVTAARDLFFRNQFAPIVNN